MAQAAEMRLYPYVSPLLPYLLLRHICHGPLENEGGFLTPMGVFVSLKQKFCKTCLESTREIQHTVSAGAQAD